MKLEKDLPLRNQVQSCTWRSGEIATFLTVITLGLMMVGTFVGIRVTNQTNTNATTINKCSHSCSVDSECSPLKCWRQNEIPGSASRSLAKICWDTSCPVPTGRTRTPTPAPTGGTPTPRSSSPQNPGGQPPAGQPISTPGPTTVGSQPAGTAFRVLELSCKVEFQFSWDPTITGITIKSVDGSKIYEITNDKVVSTDPSGQFGPINKTVAHSSGGSAGIFVSFDPTTNNNILVTVNEGGGLSTHYYIKRPQPDWLTGEAQYIVEIRYKYKLAGEFKQSQQQGRSKECMPTGTPTKAVTPTTTLTPTKSPTPTPGMCNDTCYKHSDCSSKYCYKSGLNPQPETPGNCRAPDYPTDPTCLGKITPTITPTTPVTPTVITPTIPTGIPTPPPCNAKIGFVVDTSGTTSDLSTRLNDIKAAINASMSGPEFNSVLFKLAGFNYDFKEETGAGQYLTKTEFLQKLGGLQGGHGTAIYEALVQSGGWSVDHLMYFTDGIASIDGTGNNKCAYPEIALVRSIPVDKYSAQQLQTEDPIGGAGGIKNPTIPNKPSLGGLIVDNTKAYCNDPLTGKRKKYGFVLSQIQSYPIQSGRTTSVLVGNSFDSHDTVLKHIGAGSYQKSGIRAAVKEVVDKVCPARAGGQAAGPKRVGSTFHITNNSPVESIQSVTAQLCDQSGQDCEQKQTAVNIAPGEQTRVSDELTVASTDNKDIATCSIHFSDGTDRSCPRQTISSVSDLRYSIQASEKRVTGEVKPYRQLADINGDGVVNGIDYAICIRTSTNNKCDLDLSGKVDALDRSLFINTLGESSR